MSKKKSGRRVWRGVTTATASLLALSVCASTVVDGFRTDIDKFLGTKSTKLVTENSDGTDLYTFKSDYTSTTELLHGIQDVGERMSEEGSVLLKNNGALPLTKDETQKITLLGFSSYYPVQGGDMGSSLVENTSTDADTVDMVGAFKAKGFGLNQTVADMYEALKPTYKSEVQSWGGTVEYNHITAPSTTGVFSSKEPSQAAMDSQDASWKDSMNDNNVMIVTIARSASENGSYNPGTAGVDPTQNLNQTDPLGLSDDERDLINAAVTAKAANGGKVIVLLNNASAMEVQEIEDNVGVDAILQVGLPGGYGFYGVADILSGAVSPSGHLTDTYAVKNASAPSAQNFGDLQWANANPDISMNDAIVEAENIYIGYKYYETRYFDTVMGQGNAASTVGSSTGSAWNYDDEVTYPFGYGLSYTTFEQTLDNLNVDLENETVTANVTVKNTGSVAGKDVVQLYVSLPYTDYDKEHGVEKAAIQLLDYGKTAELAPGASETVTITADMQNMASWDSTADNAAGTKGCYILDAGDYWFTIGNGAHEALNNVLAAKCGDAVAGKLIDQDGNVVTGNTAAVATWTAPNTEVDTQKYRNSRYNSDVEVTNTFDDADVNYWANDDEKITYLSRSAWDTTYPTTLETLTVNDKLYNGLNMQTYVKAADAKSVSDFNLGVELDEKINFSDMIGVAFDDPKWNDFLSQLTLSDLLINMGDSKGIKAVKAVNKPGCTIVDGPEGMNGQFKYGDRRNCTGWATLPIVGATWNHDVQTRFGEMYGEDALYASIPIAYAPGADTLRSPYSGRTSEYFSEDGVLSYYAAKAVSHGMRNKGLIGTVKHFFLNEQEAGRQGISTFANEQSIREIYMRAFEGSLAEGDSLGVMTAYNRIGVMYAAANQGIQHILRDEWNYGGYIIDDALTASEYSSAPEMLMAGNNIFCLDTARPNEIEKLITSTDDGDLLQKVIDSNHYLYYIMLQSSMGGSGAEDVVVSDAAPWWQATLRALDVVFCALAVAAVVMYVLHTYTDVFSEEKRKNRAAKKN